MATWQPLGQALEVAHGHTAVGGMASDYTGCASSNASTPGEADEPFRAMASAAGLGAELNQDPWPDSLYIATAKPH